jgi:hypothetical protein
MGGRRKARGRKPIIDSAAKVAMLAALREGRRLDEVAASYGVTLQAFHSARRRDPLFAAAWRDAHALSAEAERRCPSTTPLCDAVPLPEQSSGRNGEERIVPNNRRLLQRRKMRHVRFDERRKGVFLAHFARSCDLLAAAAAAGVCERTVFNHLRSDPAFAAAFRAALEEGYAWLEAEAVRQRLEAQKRLRAAMEESEAGVYPLALREEAVEFERAMKLLARWDRKHGPAGPRRVGDAHRKPWTFEEAVARLDRQLDNLGIRRVPPPEGIG